MAKRRIAYYLVTSGFGGVELAALAILRQLDRRVFEPVMYFRCTNPDADARMRALLAELRVPVRELDAEGLPLAAPTTQDAGNPRKRVGRPLVPSAVRSAWYSWRTARAVAQVLRSEQFDIIHVFHGWYPSHELPLIASRLAGIPVRLSDVYLEPERTGPKHPIHRLLIRLAAASATRVRAMYPRMKARLASEFRIRPERITVVPNWVDVELFAGVNGAGPLRAELGLPHRCRVVTVPARLSKEKGHAVLLEAIAKLDGTARDARFLLVGDGPLREELQRQVEASGLADRVMFLGFRTDMPAVFSASDLVVLASFTEGIPGALLEAMAAGKPIIATDVGGVDELFRRGDIGRLIQPGRPDQLSGAIRELLSVEPSRLRRMGQEARAAVQQGYASQATVQRMLALYDPAEPA